VLRISVQRRKLDLLGIAAHVPTRRSASTYRSRCTR
jgi:hypothetical protein